MNEVNFDTASENAGDNKIDVLIAKNTSYWNEFHDSLLVHIEAVLRTKCNTSTVGNKQLLTNIFYGRNGSKNLDIPQGIHHEICHEQGTILYIWGNITDKIDCMSFHIWLEYTSHKCDK